VIADVQTPFAVEYARKSRSRAYAPTLVPVAAGRGQPVCAQVFVLQIELLGVSTERLE
jgi:hypothetical protein